MQEEVTNKTVALCIRTTKLTADVLKSAMRAYLRSHSQKSNEKKQAKIQKKNQPKQGKIKVKELAAQNAGMTNIEITNKNIRSFEKYARQYGVNFALKKDRTKDPPVFFKGRDQDAINAAFREFSAKSIQKANKTSIHQKLLKNKNIVKQSKKDKVKQMHQTQER